MTCNGCSSLIGLPLAFSRHPLCALVQRSIVNSTSSRPGTICSKSLLTLLWCLSRTSIRLPSTMRSESLLTLLWCLSHRPPSTVNSRPLLTLRWCLSHRPPSTVNSKPVAHAAIAVSTTSHSLHLFACDLAALMRRPMKCYCCSLRLLLLLLPLSPTLRLASLLLGFLTDSLTDHGFGFEVQLLRTNRLEL